MGRGVEQLVMLSCETHEDFIGIKAVGTFEMDLPDEPDSFCPVCGMLA